MRSTLTNNYAFFKTKLTLDAERLLMCSAFFFFKIELEKIELFRYTKH
ncbi:hypothetical protein J2S11_003999 [Bacillus horti]|uniref:Uncharacterized protein n=1 Tax=Caldalkalibacillus horti TaxID=77523 RepID=A0ABT9W498_9BACI|nr:hypothetical protein [Bacillus horti]